MVNFNDPVLSQEVGLALEWLWHVMSGIYFWEFVTTLDYEWRVIRGHLPHRFSIWIYSLTRVACLLGVILCTAGLDIKTFVNCQIWNSFLATLFCISMASASLLIVLRIIAIWNKHKAVMATSITLWGAGVVFHINAAARLRYVWDPQVHNCLILSATGKMSVLGLVPTIIADLVLISIMIVGLLLLRRQGGGTFGLTPILLRQAVIWLSLAIVTETPPTVLALLSTNDQLTAMILAPGVIMMTIAATRMHRSLVDYASGFPDMNSAQDNNKIPMSSFSNTKRIQAVLNSRGPIEVSVHTAFERHTTTQTNDHDSYNSTNEQVHIKDAWSPDDDVERGV